MPTRRARHRSAQPYRLLSLLLALLWGGLAVGGALSCARAVPAPARAHAPAPQAARAVRRCPMSGGTRCCCHPNTPSAAGAAMALCACCAPDPPDAHAALSWLPPFVLPPPPAAPRFVPAADAFPELRPAADSRRPAPAARPPTPWV